MSDVLLELDSVHVNFAARKNWLGRVTERGIRLWEKHARPAADGHA